MLYLCAIINGEIYGSISYLTRIHTGSKGY